MEWTLEALRDFGGRGRIVDVSRHIWNHHEEELREAGDLFFTWQYDLRWAAWTLRQRGLMKPAGVSEQGLWELADTVRSPVGSHQGPSPKWVRDELILALDLYFQRGNLNARDPEVIALSETLRGLGIHQGLAPNFRSPASVNRKLGNFAALDPRFPGTGLIAGGRLDRAVFSEFASDPSVLAEEAQRVRRDHGAG